VIPSSKLKEMTMSITTQNSNINLARSDRFRAYSLKNGKTGPNGERFVCLRPSGFVQKYFREGAAACECARRENEKLGIK
jgi:hypothetical protein